MEFLRRRAWLSKVRARYNRQILVTLSHASNTRLVNAPMMVFQECGRRVARARRGRCGRSSRRAKKNEPGCPCASDAVLITLDDEEIARQYGTRLNGTMIHGLRIKQNRARGGGGGGGGEGGGEGSRIERKTLSRCCKSG